MNKNSVVAFLFLELPVF